MSNINLDWLKENFTANDTVIFDIGCADMGDTINMQRHIPYATFYAFECNEYWLHSNLDKAKQYGIHYNHLALSDYEGDTKFYPSKYLDGQEWPWSGSILAPSENLLNERWVWADISIVKTTSIEKFCDKNNVKPSFIHIDVQGAEQKVLSSMGNYRPIAIWAEICEFYMYDTETTYIEFNNMMKSLNYKQMHKDNHDALYVHENSNLTSYYESLI